MTIDLSERTRQILKLIVDAYVETGEPVGSKAISERLGMRLSPATIRHAMAELEERGLLYAPHTSAGRLPTESGLTVFVDGLLELDRLSSGEQQKIKRQMQPVEGRTLPEVLEHTSEVLAGLASCAGLVFAPTDEQTVRQIEFVLLSPGRALAVIVTGSGGIENRLIEVPADATASILTRAANYLNAQLADKTLREAIQILQQEQQRDRQELDALTARVVASGMGALAPDDKGGHLFIRGQANLLEDVTALADLERIRSLFEALEAKDAMKRVLQATTQGEGVKIFIGAENSLFTHAGCSLIVAPYKNAEARIVGAIGVIGPTRLNYRRIIPVINYTSQLIGSMIRGG